MEDQKELFIVSKNLNPLPIYDTRKLVDTHTISSFSMEKSNEN